MNISLRFAGRNFDVDLDSCDSLAIPMRFADDQPNLFGVPPASEHAVAVGDFVGSTRRGGGCNVMQWSIIPHCHGTHTESVSHIVDERLPVAQCILEEFTVAILHTVQPVTWNEAEGETYACSDPQDLVISTGQVERGIAALELCGATAIVLRTRPNGAEKMSARYDDEPVPPYFTTEAMHMIAQSRVTQLLVDIPSIDRIFDGGALANHHLFWNVPLGAKQLGDASRVERTITEFLYVPNHVEDGTYMLNLQLLDIGVDATPSRPIIWPLRERVRS